MFARIRQKILVDHTTTVTSNGTGTNGASVLLKDIARLICGNVTSLNQLNPAIWDIAGSELITTVSGGWSEYQTNLTTTETNMVRLTNNIIYLRTRGLSNTFKYLGLGYTANSTANTSFFWSPIYPWGVSDFVNSPILSFKNTSTPSTGQPNRPSFSGRYLWEYIIYSSSRTIFIAARNLSSSLTQPSKISMFLEYPATPLSSTYNLPNQVWWDLGSRDSDSSTGTGTNYYITGYKQIGGYDDINELDLNASSIWSTSINNFAFVYSPYSGSIGNTSFWGSGTPAKTLSTLKPNVFRTMSSTISSTGTAITIPVMPLIHYPDWDTLYDLSSLTGIYATKSSMGAYGDTLKVNGQSYAYINAANMSYLVPRA